MREPHATFQSKAVVELLNNYKQAQLWSLCQAALTFACCDSVAGVSSSSYSTPSSASILGIAMAPPGKYCSSTDSHQQPKRLHV